MTNHYKAIVVTDTNTVYAGVYNDKGDRVGFKIFSGFSRSLEKRFKKAHDWADAYKKLCDTYVGDDKAGFGND